MPGKKNGRGKREWVDRRVGSSQKEDGRAHPDKGHTSNGGKRKGGATTVAKKEKTPQKRKPIPMKTKHTLKPLKSALRKGAKPGKNQEGTCGGVWWLLGIETKVIPSSWPAPWCRKKGKRERNTQNKKRDPGQKRPRTRGRPRRGGDEISRGVSRCFPPQGRGLSDWVRSQVGFN